MLKRVSRLILAAVLAVACLILPVAPAAAWDIGDMNKTINQTNFVLDNQCSATLISVKERLVLTNYHCVDEKIQVVEKEESLPNGMVRKVKRYKLDPVSLVQKSYAGHEQVGSSEYIAEIVAHRKGRDLALVRIKADSLPHTVESKILPEGKQLVRGEKVYAVGNPMLLDATVTDGIISSLSRTFDFDWLDGEKLPFIQFTAPITGGNSGGALYNDGGFFVGVPAAGSRGAGAVGFAVPVSVVREMLKENCYEGVYNPAANDQACRTARDEARKKISEKVGE